MVKWDVGCRVSYFVYFININNIYLEIASSKKSSPSDHNRIKNGYILQNMCNLESRGARPVSYTVLNKLLIDLDITTC